MVSRLSSSVPMKTSWQLSIFPFLGAKTTDSARRPVAAAKEMLIKWPPSSLLLPGSDFLTTSCDHYQSSRNATGFRLFLPRYGAFVSFRKRSGLRTAKGVAWQSADWPKRTVCEVYGVLGQPLVTHFPVVKRLVAPRSKPENHNEDCIGLMPTS